MGVDGTGVRFFVFFMFLLCFLCFFVFCCVLFVFFFCVLCFYMFVCVFCVFLRFFTMVDLTPVPSTPVWSPRSKTHFKIKIKRIQEKHTKSTSNWPGATQSLAVLQPCTCAVLLGGSSPLGHRCPVVPHRVPSHCSAAGDCRRAPLHTPTDFLSLRPISKLHTARKQFVSKTIRLKNKNGPKIVLKQ